VDSCLANKGLIFFFAVGADKSHFDEVESQTLALSDNIRGRVYDQRFISRTPGNVALARFKTARPHSVRWMFRGVTYL